MTWVNQILQGVMLGGYYALLACGLSFMFGVMRIINLAHGTLAVVAAYGVVWLTDRHELNPFVGMLLAVPAMALVGWILHRLVLERSSRSGELVPILATFGLAVVLDNTLFSTFGADTRSLAPAIDTLAYDGVNIGSLTIGVLALLTFAVAVALLGGLQLLLTHTSIGRRIRAVADDPASAQLVGVDARAVNAVAAAIAIGSVAIAGTFLAMRSTVDPYAGAPQLIFAFEAVMIGGAGSLWGTLLGGIALGVAQSLGAQVHTQGFLIAGHAFFLAVLLGRIALQGRPLRSFFARSLP
jgi:branched-chain amino acid transport system permease protein